MSRVNYIVSAAFLVFFGFIWIGMALSIPAPVGPVFVLFGIAFIGYGVYGVYSKSVRDRMFKKAVDETVGTPKPPEPVPLDNTGYCPYCGSPVGDGHGYCSVCGKRLA